MNILITEKKFTQICRENPCEEDIERLKQELLAKARKRKDAARERSEKKVKNVSITGDREAPYDLEKVLKALGEVSSKIVYSYLIYLSSVGQNRVWVVVRFSRFLV